MSKYSTRDYKFILEPGQTRAEYNRLKKLWESKLAASGFNDIEHTDKEGYVSPYSTDYSLARLASNYSEDKVEYYRRASIFLQEYDWNLLKHKANPSMVKFIWAHYAAGYTMRDIEAVLKSKKPGLLKGRKPRKRTVEGPCMAPASLFFVFRMITKVTYPAFKAWVEQERNGLLASDVVLD